MQESSEQVEESRLEVIEVTARRMAENLQRVPVSVTALNEGALRDKGISSLEQVAREAPNVTLAASRATNTTLTAYIRGVGQQDPLWGFEPGVGIYIDDVYLARPQAALLDVYDVERIEVLRGPQGTLYGKNTIGGAIKYVTKSVRRSDPLVLDVAIGSYQQRDVKLGGAVELMDDTLWLGGAIARLDRGGYGRYVGPLHAGADNANKDLLAYRISLEAQPSERFTLRLDMDNTRDNANNRGGHRMTDEEVTGLPPLDNVFDTRSGIDPRQRVRSEGSALTLNWLLSDSWSLKSVTARRKGSTETNIDFDNQQLSLMEAEGVEYSDSQFSQELQATFRGQRLSGVAGLYYFDGSADGAFDLDLFRDLFGARVIGTRTIGSVDTTSTSLYAQANYELTSQWVLTLGGRYTQDKKETSSFFSSFNALQGVGSYDDQVVASDFVRSPSFSDFSPKFGVSYYASPQLMWFASYSQGFKSGGVDPRANLAANANAGDPFEPEKVATTELGFKSELLDRRLRLNLTLFDSAYRDQQVATSILIDTTGDGNADSFAGQVLNAGRSSAQGFEIETIAALSDHWSAMLTYGYINTGFDEFLTVDPETLQQINIADSAVTANTPKTTLNLGLSYSNELWDGDFRANLSAAYRSTVHLFEQPSPIDQPGVTLLDLNMIWISPSAKWELGLHGKNLTNREYRVAGYNFPAFANSVIGYYGAPRTLTANLTYRFW
ncbi:TonB-dependent receptor [Alkalimonas delamerensis]|uniref:TonB-dependent receptor n=1 Tax=Alkalimonas delamerensis TaxID=265981 RepID=A0ABT9GTK0_9GAMM|nr:TonB-dependent receptor [Alkalimonas delamerensis]MDP4530298.1 TonB-dependent receptor [Alkalimonas delamerensis]